VTRWGARFRGRVLPCAVGRGGIGSKRGEGDGVTPAGRHRIVRLLIRPDRLGPVPGAAAIGPGLGWSDDPADPDYNRPVRRPHGFGHEVMRRPDRLYDMVAVLDWNADPVVPGRGSAIFVHAWRGPRQATEGCIALAPADLAWVLARWRPWSRVDVRG